ncbi:Cof-type HAD-IIB family hydrolase [Niallia sp. Krafla_26]|uniref:Cof-type HAD-IIB family hydrolase n=1 Tax=Niallia sp. Krafla_26 TaxID=3064703 RepID=UPI003D1818FB
MAEKHLIVLDLDGTLLKDDKTISSKTKKVLFKAKEAGHEVMIATGRPYRSSEMYYKELDLKSPVVNFNGAFIHHPKDSSFGIHHSPLDMSVAKDIVDACNDFDFHNIIAEVIDDVFIHYHDEKLLQIFSYGNPNITTGDIRKFLNASPTSLLIHSEKEQVKKIRQHLAEVHAEVIEQRSWGDPFPIIEIVRHGLNKAVGLKKVSQYYGIPKDRIIAFGDEDNDLEMIDYAGYGVAMGNAIDELKNLANDITYTNEEDGIGHYLNDLLNLKAI